MTRYLGFEKVNDAKMYQKSHGGYLSKKPKNFNREKLTYENANDYGLCVLFGGLDYTKYECVLVWSGV